MRGWGRGWGDTRRFARGLAQRRRRAGVARGEVSGGRVEVVVEELLDGGLGFIIGVGDMAVGFELGEDPLLVLGQGADEIGGGLTGLDLGGVERGGLGVVGVGSVEGVSLLGGELVGQASAELEAGAAEVGGVG